MFKVILQKLSILFIFSLCVGISSIATFTVLNVLDTPNSQSFEAVMNKLELIKKADVVQIVASSSDLPSKTKL